jgi:hypothetical protein
MVVEDIIGHLVSWNTMEQEKEKWFEAENVSEKPILFCEWMNDQEGRFQE